MAFLQEYTMLDELGKGGFATVYKVRHNELDYIRAIRVLNETIVDASSNTYQKFLRECKILLRLGNGNHPNIVHIYQPRLLDNKALVEMDYVDGMDIAHYLKQEYNYVSTEEVLRMVTQISSALAYCHEEIYRFCMDRDLDDLHDDPNDGSKVLIDEETRRNLISKYKVIHNDIHSGNIMRREDGNFVLLDFGLAINGDEVVRSSRHANGAPEYKAPEKWDNESVLCEQSDIYSFGVVMYQYLAGRVPFPYNKNKSTYKAEFEWGEAHQKGAPPSIEALRKEYFERKHEGQEYQKDYPEWLEDMILKCLQKNPVERFQNGKELYDFIIQHTTKESVNELGVKRLKECEAKSKMAEEKLMLTEKKLDNTQRMFESAENELEKLKKLYNQLSTESNGLRNTSKSLNRQLNEKQSIILELQQKKLKDDDLETFDGQTDTTHWVYNRSQRQFVREQSAVGASQDMGTNKEENEYELEYETSASDTMLGEILEGLIVHSQKKMDQEENENQLKGNGDETTVELCCKKCGTTMSPNAKFCRKCGTKLID